jgi:hypothetical protein
MKHFYAGTFSQNIAPPNHGYPQPPYHLSHCGPPHSLTIHLHYMNTLMLCLRPFGTMTLMRHTILMGWICIVVMIWDSVPREKVYVKMLALQRSSQYCLR